MAIILPGEESPELRARLERLLARLEAAYPEKRIAGLYARHPHWGEEVTALYRQLGYPDGKSLLAAYGYTLTNRPMGRPPVDVDALMEELRRRYADGPCPDLAALKAENPDLAPRFKGLQNKARTLFGTSFVDYLIAQGILAGRKERTDRGQPRKRETAPERVAPEVPERVQPLLQALLRELETAFPDRTVVQSRWDHARWDRAAGRLCQELGFRSGTEFLNAFGFRVEP